MPTLFRLISVVLVIGGLGFAGMVALAALVKPEPREMSVTIPPSRFGR